MKGICGLGNLGNSCYMNATLQILSQMDELNDYLVERKELIKLPDSVITFEWIQLYQLIQQNHCSVIPNRFVERLRQVSIQKKRPEFASFQHNDSVEFFAFLLDCIHNSLNGLDTSVKHQNNHPSLHAYLEGIEQKDSSIVQQLFMSCSMYHYVHPVTHQIEFSKIEHEIIVSLSIPDSDSTVTLEDCFVETFKEEVLSGENAWFDEKDQTKKTVVKKSALCHTPPLLILHLKRWRTNLSKKHVRIHAPLSIDLQKFTLSPIPCPYELFGIINHEGTIQHGHYYSYVKKKDWYSINDQFIQSITPEQLIHENNYCLFYRKIK
jgi:ubiquitin carboxyl-terminal hydrolase 8